MTTRQTPPQRGTRHAGKRWYRFGDASKAVRHTEAWSTTLQTTDPVNPTHAIVWTRRATANGSR